MIFADLLLGEAVFLDANTFVYHFAPHPVFGSPCTQLLDRAGRAEIQAFTSTHMLSEVAHRLMAFEAAAVLGWPQAKIVQRLKQHPNELQKLKDFRQAIEDIPGLGVQMLTIPPHLVAAAAVISQQTGLLSNDALIVAVMNHYGLNKLASNDADFDRVPGLTCYAPT